MPLPPESSGMRAYGSSRHVMGSADPNIESLEEAGAVTCAMYWCESAWHRRTSGEIRLGP